MKIKTELLQKMVSKVIQGASMNKMLPLTSLIGIEFKDKNLILITTDGSNQFRVNNIFKDEELVGLPKEFYTIVNAETFVKLIGKTTKEFVNLENKENYLEIVGNGIYKLEIAINEEGEMVKFPEINNIEGNEFNINLKDLQESINTAKASVMKTMEAPCLTGYYIGKNMITTDRQLICKLNKSLLSEPILLSSEMAELLLLVEGDEILYLAKKDNNLIFYNSNYKISGKELQGKDIYPVKSINNLAELEYKNFIKVNKDDLLNVLDRMSLFVTDYDTNAISLSFTKEALCITSQKSNAQELINAKGSSEEEYDVVVNIEMLKSQVQSVSTDDVEIHYGQDKMIKIVDGDTILVLALL